MGNTSSVDISSMNDTTFITLPSNYSDSPLQPTTSTLVSNVDYTKQDMENIAIVKSKLLHYLSKKGQENQVPDHVLNFIIEPLSVETELKGSYLSPDWKITSRMVEIYEFMCFKYVHNSHYCKQDEDYKKLLSVMRAHLATAHANALNTAVDSSTITTTSKIGSDVDNHATALNSSSTSSVHGSIGNVGGVGNSQAISASVLPPTVGSSGNNVEGNVCETIVGSNVALDHQSESVSTAGGAVGSPSSSATERKVDLLLKRRSQSFSGISQINLIEIQDNLQTEKSLEIKKTAASTSFTEQSKRASSPKSPKDENDEKNDSTASRLKRTLSNLKKVPKLKLPELSFSKSPKSSRANSVSSPKDNQSSSALSITTSQSTSNLEIMDKRASMRSILIDPKSFNQPHANNSHQDNEHHHQTSEQEKGTKMGLLKKLGSFKKTKSGNNISQSVGNTPLIDPFSDDTVVTKVSDDDDRVLTNTEHDHDEMFKAMKSQYMEDRKQKREQYHTHNFCFNAHEFMEHENMEHAKAIDDLMAKRVCSCREDVVKNEIDMKRLFSKNDELPFYIKEKLAIIASQRGLTNQLLSIKLVIFDCSCKQSIIRLLSPVKETLEFSNNNTKGYELGLLIGPWLLTYHEDIGLVIPSKIIPPLENVLFDLGTLDLSSSLGQLCEELATTVIEWNTKRFYSRKRSDPMPDYLKDVSKVNMTSGSSYDFVVELLSNLGVRLNLSDNPSLQLLFSNIKSKGSSPMVWVTEKNEEIEFESHAQLDDYVNNLSKTSNNSIAIYRSLDWELLKSYDRVFWAKHLSGMNGKFDPSFSHETSTNCPFKHPYLV